MLILRSNSYNWWIKHQVLLFNNAVQELSLKESFRMKTRLKYRQLWPLIFLFFSFLPLSPFFPSSCLLQVNTGRVWRIRPPQWICPTCRRRDDGWEETRTARLSTPSPRCRWGASPLRGKDDAVFNVFYCSVIIALHFVHLKIGFFLFYLKKRRTDREKWFSLKDGSPESCL